MEVTKNQLSEAKKKQYTNIYYISELIFVPIYLYFLIAYNGLNSGGIKVVLIILLVYAGYRVLPGTFHRRFLNLAENMLTLKSGIKAADRSVFLMIIINVIAKVVLLYIMFS